MRWRRSPTAGGSCDDADPRSIASATAIRGRRGAALDDVSLTIEPGELVVIAGGSGSGKSTLLRAVSGLVPHFHGGTFAGTVTVGGLDTRSHGPGELAASSARCSRIPRRRS